MKSRKFLSTLIFLFLIVHSFAQVNDYFLNNPKWQVKYRYYDGSGWMGSSDEYNYTVVGDTIINFLTYKKIQRNGVVTNIGFAGEPLSSSSYSNSTYSALLRSVGKKMYYFGGGADSTSDILMYDYNLNVGDTVPLSISSVYNGSPVLTVTAIDSFYTSAGYRKRFHLGASLYLYEGVGTIGGLLEDLFGTPSIESTTELICFSLNDSSYVPSVGLSCDVSTGVVEHTADEFALAFPNPFSNETLISTTVFLKNAILHLYDSKGSLVKVLPFSGMSVSIDRGELNSGIYCYSIIETDHPTNISGKLIVTDK